MCILFLYADPCPNPGNYKLILASNRDEFFVRPAATAAQWVDAPYAYGGLDMEPGREGGTWLAISGKDSVIKVGALLNITGENTRPHGIGRGPVVVNYIKGNTSNEVYSKQLIEDPLLFNAFNFVSVEIRDRDAKILHCSNAPPYIKAWSECKPHGFGNSPVGAPFQKVKMGTEIFGNIIENYNKSDKTNLVEKCMNLLKMRKKFWPDEEILRRAPHWGEDLSAICVQALNDGYGSRTSSVILVDWENKMDFYENTMMTSDPNGEWKNTHIQRQL